MNPLSSSLSSVSSMTSALSDDEQDMNIIGGGHEHVAFQILLNIPDDNDFVDAASTSHQMLAITEHQRIWKERLEKYYPQFLELRKKLGMNYKDFYPIASNIDKIQEGEIEQLPTLMKYVVNFPVDWYTIIQELDETSEDAQEELIRAYKNVYNKRDEIVRSALEFAKNSNDISANYILRYSPAKWIFQYNNPTEEELIEFFNDNIQQQHYEDPMEFKLFTDFIWIFCERFGPRYEMLVYDIQYLNQKTAQKYKNFPKLANKLTHDKLYGYDNLRGNYHNIIEFMVRNSIRPDYSVLLPTTRYINSRLEHDFSSRSEVICLDYVNETDEQFEIFAKEYLNIIQMFARGGVKLTERDITQVDPRISKNSPLYMELLRECL